MLILGIETSTRQVGVALAECQEGGGVTVLAAATSARGARHAEALTPAVAFICRSGGVALSDVVGVAVGIGPGLFTGLRVGVATAQAMALALDVPLVGLSSLDLVAHRLRTVERPVVVAMDARRSELFWAPYQPGGGAGLQRAGADRADPPEHVASSAAQLGGGPGAEVVVVGDGPDRYPAAFAAHPGITVLGGSDGLPSPVAVVQLGALALAAGRGVPAGTVAPVYVREPDAAASWPQRLPGHTPPGPPGPSGPPVPVAGVRGSA